MKQSTLKMTHEEWLLDRRKGLGGSDIATVLGLNKWKSPYQLWLDKTGQIDVKEQEQSEPAYWGNVLEEVVAKEFQERTGKRVRRRNQVFEHLNYPFLRANIDRDVIGENAILECKTANAFLGKEWEGEEVPLSYLCQVQHYMNVLNKDYAYFAVLVGGQKFIWKKIERDQELIDAITKKLVDFWENNVLKGIEPPLDGSEATTEFVRNATLKLSEKEVEFSSNVDELLDTKADLEKTVKELTTEIKKIDNQIKFSFKEKDASIAITPKRIITYKLQKRVQLNKKKVEEKYPEIVKDESFYTISEFRILREKGIR